MNRFAGIQKLEIADKKKGIVFPVLILYPTSAQAALVSIGPYRLDASWDVSIADGMYPLVVISHGSGGSNLAYHTLAVHLAKSGFVVCMPEHPFNNRNDNRLEGTMEIFEDRLRQISLTIDFMFAQDQFNEHLKPDHVAVIGHSIGANTALVLAGARPIPASEYRKKYGPMYHEKGGDVEDICLTTDNRIKAVVLFALTPGWFSGADSLKDVAASVLLLNAEKDAFIPCPEGEAILNSFPKELLVRQRIVKNAGHFSFLSPFPEAIKARVGLAAKDPEGFDREAFHRDLNEEVVGFLNQAMEE